MSSNSTPMETSQQQISIESFSYSWLVNLKPSPESLGGSPLRAPLDIGSSDETNSFIEMDPRLPPSKRFIRGSQDFRFDFPDSEPAYAIVDADELFSNGYLMPLFIDPLKMESYQASNSGSATLKVSGNKKKNRNSSLKRYKKLLSRRLFQQYLDLLRPLYRRIKGCGSGSLRGEKGGGGGNDRRVHVMDSWVCNSSGTSPRVSLAYSADDWRRSCDSESSIYEAVLHCKRSIGKFA